MAVLFLFLICLQTSNALTNPLNPNFVCSALSCDTLSIGDESEAYNSCQKKLVECESNLKDVNGELQQCQQSTTICKGCQSDLQAKHEAYDNCQIQFNECKEKYNVVNGHLRRCQTDLGQCAQAKEKLVQNHQNCNRAKKELESELTHCKDRNEWRDTELSNLRQQITSLEDQIAKLQTQNKEQAEEITQYKVNIAKYDEENKGNMKQIKSLQETNQFLKEKTDRTFDLLIQTQTQLSATQVELADNVARFEKYTKVMEENEALRVQITKLLKEIRQWKHEVGECNAEWGSCEQSRLIDNATIVNMNAEIEKWKTNFKICGNSTKQCRKQKKEKVDELEEVKEKLAQMEDESQGLFSLSSVFTCFVILCVSAVFVYVVYNRDRDFHRQLNKMETVAQLKLNAMANELNVQKASLIDEIERCKKEAEDAKQRLESLDKERLNATQKISSQIHELQKEKDSLADQCKDYKRKLGEQTKAMEAMKQQIAAQEVQRGGGKNSQSTDGGDECKSEQVVKGPKKKQKQKQKEKEKQKKKSGAEKTKQTSSKVQGGFDDYDPTMDNDRDGSSPNSWQEVNHME